MNDAPSEELLRQRELSRIRSARYYEKNRDKVLARRKPAEKQQSEPAPPVPAPNPPAQPISTHSLERIQTLMAQSETTNRNTLKKYTSSLNTIHRLTAFTDLASDINTPDFIKRIDESDLGIGSKKTLMATILWLNANIIPLNWDATTQQRYVKQFELYKLREREEAEDKQMLEENAVMPFDAYITAIKEKYGEDSIQYLIARIYDEFTYRNDFENLIIVRGKNYAEQDPNYDNTNYIVMPSRGNAHIILNTFKKTNNFDKYGVLKYEPLSTELTQIIRQYIKNHKLTFEQPLFQNHNISAITTAMNKELGIKGGIVNFRRMKVSQLMANAPTDEQRVELALFMKHSPISQMKYVRKLKIP